MAATSDAAMDETDLAPGGQHEEEGAAEDTAAQSAEERLLKACTDSRLISALPALLQALPEDAQDRILMVVREALIDELEGGVLQGEEANVEAWRVAWRRALDASARAATSEKRPFRAMSMPFAAVAQEAKRSKVEEEDVHSEVPALTTKLYVANLPYTKSEQDVWTWFDSKVSALGKVQDVRFLLHPDTSKPKGAAVITFDSVEAASEALLLDGQPGLEFRKLIVKPDGQKGRKGDDKGEGKGRLKRGAKGEGKGTSRAEKGADKGQKGEEHSSAVSVVKSVAEQEKDAKSVVVKNLSWNAEAAHLGELFAGCGEVAAVRIAKDARTGRPRGFAVVEFTSKDAVAQALERSGREVRGRACRVEAIGAAPKVADSPEKEVADLSEKDVVVPGDGLAVVAESVEAKESGNEAAALSIVAAIAVQGEHESKAIHAEAAAGHDSTESGDAIRKHAQLMVAQAQEPVKRARGEKPPPATEPTETFLGGEAGLQAAVEWLDSFDSPEAMAAAVVGDSVKGRLTALGLKSGGSPQERAERLLRLQGITSLDQVPVDMLDKVSKKARAMTLNKGPVVFVKAGAAGEAVTEKKDVEVAD